MKSKLLTRWPALLGLVALLNTGGASAGEVRVMISAGFFDVYAELSPAFERTTGHRLVTIRGPSTGDSPEAIPTRLARGESADVVILEGGSADELGKKGSVRTDSKVVLALVQTGLVVRAGTASLSAVSWSITPCAASHPHRPHRGRSLRPPLHEPGEVIDMTARIRSRMTVSGLINEYDRVA